MDGMIPAFISECAPSTQYSRLNTNMPSRHERFHPVHNCALCARTIPWDPGIAVTEGFDGGKKKRPCTRRDWESWCRTMYKRKGKKINPVNKPLPGGVRPGGNVGNGSTDFGGTGLVVPRGTRITPERLAKMHIGDGFLTEQERQLFIDILYEFEGAVAFDDSEMGLVKPEIEPPVVIHTVPHDPWQQPNLRLPKAMQDAATSIVKEKQALGIIEHSQGPYRSRYFIVKKKTGAWRLINDVQPLNRVTIKEAGMPPSVDEFSEDFAGYPIVSAFDYWSGYYEVSVDPASRDLTAFMTDVGLVRLTRLPQGWTNSVSCFQRIVCKVHWSLIPSNLRPFIDDIGLKGPKTRYNNEEVEPGIRRFVYEHALLFRKFLHQVWVSGMTISGPKAFIGMPGIDIVGYLCDADGRRPEPKKIQRIRDWPTPRSLRDARAFVGIVVYYRIFIKDFASIAAPIFRLFRKKVEFEWSPECGDAMVKLKDALSNAPVLVSLDFSPSALGIELDIDASTTIGWGAILCQWQEDGNRHPARFESGIWSDAEKKYDALKLECRGLIKALKKLRFWLFGRFFTVNTDSQTLVWLLNQPPNDLPNAMMTRWLAYARLFDFDVKHIKGSGNGAADGLSRRGKGEIDEEDSDPDEYFDAKLYSTKVQNPTQALAPPVSLVSMVSAISYFEATPYDRYQIFRVFFDPDKYEDSPDDVLLGKYLSSLERPPDLTDSQYQQLRRKSKNFLIRDGLLFKRPRQRGIPPRRVVGMYNERVEIISRIHDELGHPGQKATYNQIAKRYQWRGMYNDTTEWVKTCDECQKRSKQRFEEPLHPTWSVTVWEKVGLDVIYMPYDGKEGYLVLARDDLSGYPEGRALEKADSESVAKFLHEEVFCRHGVPRRIVMDVGSENLGLTKLLLLRYGVHGISIAPYHPQSNGLVERGYQTILNALAKYKAMDALRTGIPKEKNWTRYLSLALWANRITARRSTGYSAFELVYGRECLLPIQLAVTSWSLINWDRVKSREDLITARIRQLDERISLEETAALQQRRSREQNKAYFDSNRNIRPEKGLVGVGDLVLSLRDPKADWGVSHREEKLDERWQGPYRIREKPENSTFYLLEELDGTPLRRKFAGNQIKKYFQRTAGVWQPSDATVESEETAAQAE